MTTVHESGRTALDTGAVARWLGVPESTLRYWRHRNTGPRSFAVGRSVRYRVEDVEAWLEARMRATGRGEVIDGNDDGGRAA